MKRNFLWAAGLGLCAVAIAGCGRPIAQNETTQNEVAAFDTPALEKTAPVEPREIEPKSATPRKIKYSASFEEALKLAHAQNKPLMVDFYTDWCGVCKMMDSRVFNQQPIIEEAQNFVVVKVNAEKRDDLARTFAVDGYPTFIWLDRQGDIIDRLDGGMMAEGFLEKMKAARDKFSAVKL